MLLPLGFLDSYPIAGDQNGMANEASRIFNSLSQPIRLTIPPLFQQNLSFATAAVRDIEEIMNR
jgi:hypothetical protein